MKNSKPQIEDLSSEIVPLTSDPILSSEFRKKKLILWMIRTSLTVVLYIIFWEYDWVRWSLFVTIPLSLLSLTTIIGLPYLLKRKIKKINKKLEATENKILDKAKGA